jgi:hypothetical protein
MSSRLKRLTRTGADAPGSAEPPDIHVFLQLSAQAVRADNATTITAKIDADGVLILPFRF